MAKYKKGRKIKHVKTIYTKKTSPSKKIIIAVVTVVALVGVFFLGYSITPPVIKFFKNIGSSDSKPYTPSVNSEASEESSKQDSQPAGVSTGSLLAYNLPSDALASETSLTSAAKDAKDKGYTAICVTLKQQGGKLTYLSSDSTALDGGAVSKNSLSIDKIAGIIKENGLKPVGIISVLNDNLAPVGNENIAYKFENESSRWLDNSVDKGGKPWISPFAAESKKYLSGIVTEIANGGFTEIIGTDFIFPPFRDYDLDVLGSIVKSNTRYTALTDMVTELSNVAVAAKSQLILQVDFSEVVQGKCEVFVPEKLTGVKAIVNINLKGLSGAITATDSTKLDFTGKTDAQKMKIVADQLKKITGLKGIVPKVDITNISDGDINQVKKAITDAGFTEYILVK